MQFKIDQQEFQYIGELHQKSHGSATKALQGRNITLKTVELESHPRLSQEGAQPVAVAEAEAPFSDGGEGGGPLLPQELNPQNRPS